MKVYMDYGAASPVDPRVVNAMMPYFSESFGNPSSFHGVGYDAVNAINIARKQVESLIRAETSEIVFTSSATESNNLGIIGSAMRYKKRGKQVVTTNIEHISVMNVCKELQREGFSIKYVPVDRHGILKLDKFEEVINDDTVLVTIIAANGEIGTIQPIKEAAEIAHNYGALFHTDATAAAGKIPLDVKKLGVDFMTLSSNDIYGPKGVGALYVKKGLRLKPLMIGGGQEQGLRSSSENVPGIVGMGKAAEISKKEMKTLSQRITKLRDKLIQGITSSIPESYLNGHPTKRLPNNANLRFNYIEGESLLLSLDHLGIQASSGSACTAKTLEPSATLLALGLKHEEAHGSLVFTMGRRNNNDDVKYVLQKLPGVVKRLRAMSPLTPKEMR